jgi:hypothetical protein
MHQIPTPWCAAGDITGLESSQHGEDFQSVISSVKKIHQVYHSKVRKTLIIPLLGTY